ncbi:MAG: cytochrome P450 [Chloroflexota bacterium]|nr:cytochrome P450 [Chloroflexota bacterium]MDQ5867344.1 cytochrome P450 [Chloroflexota bacterium]
MATITAGKADTTLQPSTLKTPLGPKGEPIIGSIRAMRKDPLRFLLNVSRRYGDVAQYTFVSLTEYLINHPAGVKRVLQENNRNYSKDVFDYNILKEALGYGLLTNEGESWLSQRRLMQPAFHRQRLAAFGTLMTDSTTQMLDEKWNRVAAQGREIDVASEMHDLALRIVGEALFSLDLTRESQAVGKALTIAQRRIIDQFFFPFIPMRVPTPNHVEFRKAVRAIDEVVFKIIGERRRNNEDRGDLLSMLMLARDADTGEGMNDQQLRDEVITLLLAGHETTANALTWAWYLLSQNPMAARRMREELQEVLGGRTPTVADLPKLTYTKMVLDETMRLYPPAWAISRKAIEEDELAGYRIPAGAIITVSPYAMHHNPRHWDNPEGFDPERFTPERSAQRPPYAYFPFGGGPRLCIGNNFALMEGQLILATIAQRYRLDLVPGHPVVVEPLITLRARYGMRMVLHPLAHGKVA